MASAEQLASVTIDKAAELMGKRYRASVKWLKRRNVILKPDPKDRRRMLVPVDALPRYAQENHWKAQSKDALASAFTLTAPNDAPSSAPAASNVPDKNTALIDRKLAVLGECMDHRYKTLEGQVRHGVEIHGADDYVRALSNRERANGFPLSVSTIYDDKKIARRVLKSGGTWVDVAVALMPEKKKGLAGKSYFDTRDKDNDWQWPFVRSLHLNQACLSDRRVFEMLEEEIESREKAVQGTVIYTRPTLKQVRLALKKISLAERVMGRDGEKAYDDKCGPYISRRPPEESGAFVCTDGKLLDILCRDSGWRVGRIWWVPFADVASERWLGHAFGPTISGDMVMDSAAWMLEEACVPGAVQIDRGKEFQGQRFTGGDFKISGEKVFEEMEGMWQRLGVKVVSAIGRNPKTKPIERLFRSLRRFEQVWSTYTGPNSQERPPQLQLIERQVKEFKAGNAPPPPVPTIDQVTNALVWWCKNRWNAQHRGHGKYRRGMTPDEAWNVKCPAAGHRRLSRKDIDYYTSDRRFVKVARGGQVNLTLLGQTLEYVAPELFHEQGKPVEVLRKRLDSSQVEVIYPVAGGTASCFAQLKGQLPWGSESRCEVAVRLRCINSVKRTLKRSLKTVADASRLLPEAPYLPTEALLGEMAAKNLVNARQLFGTSAGAPGPRPDQEISGSEWMMRKRDFGKGMMTAEERVEAALKIEEGE